MFNRPTILAGHLDRLTWLAVGSIQKGACRCHTGRLGFASERDLMQRCQHLVGVFLCALSKVDLGL